jgi:DNA repair exonuclease SbcCD nuclease subunit
MHIQIASDLHIEQEDTNIVNINDYLSIGEQSHQTILILAGDIGSFYQIKQLRLFLQECSRYYYAVLYIPGNHEYYIRYKYNVLSFEILYNRLIDMVNSIDNVILLNKSIMKIKEYVFIGCTLWSYANILPKKRVKIHGLTRDDYNDMHQSDIEFLNKSLNKFKNNTCIVITHHAPTYKLLSKRKLHDKFSDLYASNSDFLFKQCIKYWIYGHTHDNIELIENGVHIICNQKGNNRKKATNYNNNKLIIM